MLASERQYGRDDVDYGTWYSDWMRDLARQHSREELERMLGGSAAEAQRAAAAHHRAVAASSSMQSQSQRRAQTGNVVAAAGERATALRGALEIHDLFPEHARPHPTTAGDGARRD